MGIQRGARERRTGNSKGQGLVEYALIVGLVALITMSVLSELGFNTSEAIGNVPDMISGNPPSPGQCHGATMTQHLQHCACPTLPHTCKATGWSC